MRAAGPLGRYVNDEAQDGHLRFGSKEANAQTLLRRVAWDGFGDEDAADRMLLEQAASRMFPRKLLDAANRRRVAAVARLAAQGGHVEQFDVRPIDRMVLGLGDENPREIGFRLHGTYGVPILPGQALKGVARAADKAPIDVDQVPAMLGEKARGAVIFLDALPLSSGNDRVTLDVLTPHGAEWEQPTPVLFLTATSRLTFRVNIVVMGPGGEEAAVLYARPWLKAGLEDVGLGAKTSSGYGYMTTVEEAPG